MATVKWSGAPTSRGTVLTTEMNSLANNAFCAVGSGFDNTSNLDEWFSFELVLASLNPTAGAYVNIYAVPAYDGGTNFADAPSSTNPGNHLLIATLSITTGSAAKRQMTLFPIQLPPGDWKFVVKNGTGVSFGASGNTLTLYSFNESVA